MRHTNLRSVNRTKHDHFCAVYQDVASEISNYTEYLKGKKIYCPCDHPKSSPFWKYLSENFNEINPVSVRSTYLNSSYKGQVSLLVDGAVVEFDMQGDGDFTSKPCQDLVQLDNVIITQPPFSKVYDFIKSVVTNRVQFLVLCSSLLLKNKFVFNLLKNNQIWVKRGVNTPKFYDSETCQTVRFGYCVWLTNIGERQDSDPIPLVKNYFGYERNYPRFDNLDAIDVDKLKNIPKDYLGVMAIPVTYLRQICSTQFEILGMTSTVPFTKKYENLHRYMKDGRVIKDCASDGFIKFSSKPEGTYYIADNSDGYLRKSFTKVLVKRVL